MRNDNSGQEDSGIPPVRRCGYCGQPLLSQRRGAKWCSREHKELARQRRKRASDRLTSLRANHPFADSADLREFSDEFNLIGNDDDHQDEDQGIVVGDVPDPWQQRNDAWAARQEFADAIDAIRADYERLMRPYLEQQRRNPGPMQPKLAALMRGRDARIRDLTRHRQLAEAMEWAARDRPGRVASARERQGEQAAARAFALDLGKGRFLGDDPAYAGRDVRSAWKW